MPDSLEGYSHVLCDAEAAAPGPPAAPLRLVAWEVTRRCPLSCRHCRGAARDTEYAGELTTAEAELLIDRIAEFASPILIFTGGEPMIRPDVYDLAARAAARGLRPVMSPCGPLLNEQSVRRLLEAGIRRVSVSIDGKDAAAHDALRGQDGAFHAVVRGVRCATAAGLEVQVHTVVTRLTVDDVPAILDLAEELGAVSYSPFVLVPAGRGRELRDIALSAGEHERFLRWLWRESGRRAIEIRPTCAPEYARIMRQFPGEGRAPRRMSRGCLAGNGFVFVSHVGDLQPCGFFEQRAGNLRAVDFDFRRLYEESPLFRALRDPDRLTGRCGRCEYVGVCGGCRARALAAHGSAFADDPLCPYRPRGAGA